MFNKGQSGNPNGRPAGSINATSKQAKELISDIVLDELANIKELLNELTPPERAYLICKLLPYVIPKSKETDQQGEMIITIVDESTSPYDADKY